MQIALEVQARAIVCRCLNAASLGRESSLLNGTLLLAAAHLTSYPFYADAILYLNSSNCLKTIVRSLVIFMTAV